MPNLAVIIASTRPGRVGPQIASWFLELASEFTDFNIDVLDLGEIALPFLDELEHPSSGVYHHEHTRAWSARVAAADAFVFVMPEYNFAMTAPLKNAIDYLYNEWAYKPVGFVSYVFVRFRWSSRSLLLSRCSRSRMRSLSIFANVSMRPVCSMPARS
jgi:NAD(P)H-dependent FMN reductase